MYIYKWIKQKKNSDWYNRNEYLSLVTQDQLGLTIDMIAIYLLIIFVHMLNTSVCDCNRYEHNCIITPNNYLNAWFNFDIKFK